MKAEIEKEKALREVYERKLEAKERALREMESRPAAVSEAPVEAPKAPVSELADAKDDSFTIELRPLRRVVDENQLSIDTAEEEKTETAPEKEEPKPITHSDDKDIENQKKKAQKRVRSMFDLITFDNV